VSEAEPDRIWFADRVPALVEVTPSMLMCSWASLVSYASLTVSFSPALRSFGWYAMIGELTTLTTAIVFLPAMLRLLPIHLWHAPEGEALEEDAAVRGTQLACHEPSWRDIGGRAMTRRHGAVARRLG